MKIVAVTSAFLNVRPDRSPEYYTRPLNDFCLNLDHYHSGLETLIFTEPWNKDLFPENSRTKIHLAQPEDLIINVWDNTNWRGIYQSLIKQNPTHYDSYQARFPLLVAVYLGKIDIIRQAFTEENADVVFWFDSGHWISAQCGHDIEKYTSSLLSSVRYETLSLILLKLAQKYGILGCRSKEGKKRFHMPLEIMYSYANDLGFRDPQSIPLYQAPFLLVHKQYLSLLIEGFRKWWSRLIDNGHAGTEENAITLLGWEKRIPCLLYTDWISLLHGQEAPEAWW